MRALHRDPRPASGTASEWAELAFDLTAIGLGLAWLVGTGYVVLLGVGETVHFLGETATPPVDPVEPGPRVCQESSGGDNRCAGG